MSSIPNGQKDEWSSASQELFRAARSDHAPTSADRERVRRALAERIAVEPGASGGAGANGLVGQAASALSRVLMVGFGVSLVVVATIAVKRAQEPAHSAQSGAVQVASGASSAASNATSTVAQGAAARSGEATQPLGANAAELAAQDRSRGAASSAASQLRDATAQARDDSSTRGARRAHARAGHATVGGTARASAPPGAAVEYDSQLARASRGTDAARGSLPLGAAVEGDSQLARASRGTDAARGGQPLGAAVEGDRATDAASHTAQAALDADARVARAETSARVEQPQPARAKPLEATGQAAGEPQPKAARVQGGSANRGRQVESAADVREPGDERAAQPGKVAEQEDGPAEDARAELAFVRKMQAALRADEAEDVLELCAEHAERWPHGTFVQEREGLRAIASCNTSAQGADARAKAFLNKYPRTPLGPRVREACKLQPVAAAGGKGPKTAR